MGFGRVSGPCELRMQHGSKHKFMFDGSFAFQPCRQCNPNGHGDLAESYVPADLDILGGQGALRLNACLYLDTPMDASIVHLRYRMKDVLRAIDRGETVTVLYRGK